MKNWKTIFGSLGILVGVAVPSLVTLSCKKEEKPQLENAITVKKEKFSLAEFGIKESSLTVDQFKEQITPGFIYKHLNVFFNNVDFNKITEGNIKVKNAIPNTSKTSILVSVEIKGLPFQFEIVGFKIEDTNNNPADDFIYKNKVFNATQFSGDSGDLSQKTIAEAKAYIEGTDNFIQTHKDVLFEYIHETLLTKFNTKTNIELIVIGDKLFVNLYEDKNTSNNNKPKFSFEITGFKDDTQSDIPGDTPGNTPGGDAIVEIKSSIEIESSDFVDLKDKTLKQGLEFFQGNKQWLLTNQSKIFGTSDLKDTEIEITSLRGPEWIWQDQNDVRIALNVRDKSVLLTIKNFVPNIEVKTNLTAANLSFDIVAPSEAVSVITKDWIWFNRYKLFTITDGVVSSDNISEPVSIVNGNNIEVKVKLFDKEFNFTISGFKDKYIVAQRTEFDIKELDVKTNGDRRVSTFVTHMTNLVKGEGVMKDNHKILLSSYGLTTGSGIKVTKITTKLTGSGSVQVTVEFDNNIDKTTFKVKGLEQDVTYIKHVQATAIYATSTLYKFKFVITGEKLPTSKFVNNFRVKRVTYKADGTPIYTDAYRNYWGYTKAKQTAEKIEVEITKTGVWKPGDVMVIHRAGRDVSEGFQLTLPW
ncbi:MAG: hypothetical protein IJ997_03200 [Mycoplasmataceae bacterium]|nr:hypothetical protein [Mycoplasmataceae bacterium]